jgi:hypothetical protein
MVHHFSPRGETVSPARHVENSSSSYHTDLAAGEVEIWQM